MLSYPLWVLTRVSIQSIRKAEGVKRMRLIKQLRKVVAIVIIFCLSIFPVPHHVLAQMVEDPVDSNQSMELNILKGELATLKVYSLTRLSISDPHIADVASADAEKLLIIGKNIGQTPFFIWDEKGKRTIMVRVYEENLAQLKVRIETLLKAAGLEGVTVQENKYEGKVMFSGQLRDDKFVEFSNIVSPFSSRTVNLVIQEANEDLIQIDMQIAELSTSLQKSLGFDWTTGSNSSLKFTYTEAIPKAADQLGRFIKIGDFTRTSALLLTINNLIEEGKGRILSKPKLVVVSGKQASFQVGGQIPIRTTTTTGAGGVATESVSFKDYGVTMNITPTIRSGKVDITLSVTVSDIDAANKVNNDVAFTTRSAQTQLFLEDQQTIVLAGLIKSTRTQTVKKIPFLGSLPIIGMVFRSRSNPAADADTEVVISLTPTIIRSAEKQAAQAAKAAKAAAPAPVEETKMSTNDAADVPEKAESKFLKDVDQEIAQDSPSTESSATAGSGSGDDIAEPAQESSVPDEAVVAGLEKVDMPDKDQTDASAAGAATEEQGATLDLKIEEGGATATTTSYAQTIQKKISEAISYPYEALEKGWEGTVKLTLKVLKDGTLDEVTVKESSGHDAFDKDALNTAQILSPFDPFPPELELNEIILTVPIIYSQKPADSSSVKNLCPPSKMASKDPKPFVASGKTYEQLVQERLARSIIYPDEAKQYGWEGTVKLSLRILKDGTLATAAVKESSGHEVFDECALQAAKNLAPYSVFPPESKLQELNVTVPIVYSLER